MSGSYSSKRIVLVDPLGEILFSGDSVISKEAEIEPCPETKRSAESGTYRAVDPTAPVTEEAPVVDPDGEIATPKRGSRAA